MFDSVTPPTGCEAATLHISQPIPPVLWHYTSFEAMQGIVVNKVIWASEYRFLNDQEEYLHAKKLTDSVVDDEAELGANGFPRRGALKRAIQVTFDGELMHESRLRIMVASFSAAGDQLSQWRGYAGESTGVSIGLDLRHLRGPNGIAVTETFAPCLYKEEEKRALLKAIFAEYLTAIEQYWATVPEGDHSGVLEQLVGNPDPSRQSTEALETELDRLLFFRHLELQFDLLRVAPLLKNESFSEEREWRLVLPVHSIFLPTNRAIQFRPTLNSLIPYVAFPLLVRRQEGPINCTHVFLGPGSHPSAPFGVNMFLVHNGIPTPAIPSKIPYRAS